MSQPTPGGFWLQFPRVIGEGQLDDPTPPRWPLWRTTYLCTTSPLRMLSKWPWISRCGDYWQQAELCTDGACRIMMMMMMSGCHLPYDMIAHTKKYTARNVCTSANSVLPSGGTTEASVETETTEQWAWSRWCKYRWRLIPEAESTWWWQSCC